MSKTLLRNPPTVGLPDGMSIPVDGRLNTFPACYSMDLYCAYSATWHEWNEFPHAFLGETFEGCARQARANGWIVPARREPPIAICPKCAEALRKKGIFQRTNWEEDER